MPFSGFEAGRGELGPRRLLAIRIRQLERKPDSSNLEVIGFQGHIANTPNLQKPAGIVLSENGPGNNKHHNSAVASARALQLDRNSQMWANWYSQPC